MQIHPALIISRFTENGIFNFGHANAWTTYHKHPKYMLTKGPGSSPCPDRNVTLKLIIERRSMGCDLTLHVI